MGVVLMVVGAFVIGASTVATIAISRVVGFALIVGGIAQLFHAGRYEKYSSPGVHFLIAAFAVLAGGVILTRPLVGAMAITLMLAVYLMFTSAAKAVLVSEGRVPHRNWMIFSAAVSFLLGAWLFVALPFASLVVPGTILGADLIFYGLTLTVISGQLHSDSERIAEPETYRETYKKVS